MFAWQENVLWEREESGALSIYQYLHCGKRSRAVSLVSVRPFCLVMMMLLPFSSLRQSILVGRKGSKIQTIREEATRDLEDLFQCPVDLTLHVKK